MSIKRIPTVLFFDSGVGGLSVYLEVRNRLPELNYVYLFDNEAYPYGELEHHILIERASKLINATVKQHSIDLVVIACNTASTVVLPFLRKSLAIPVVGVVPAIKPASVIATKAIGLIATPATINRDYTHDLIADFSPNTQVKLLGSTELVEMAELKLRGEGVSMERLQEILLPLIGEIDVAVLGCTHFPLLKKEISQVLGAKVCIVDSGKAIAVRVASLLNREHYNFKSQDDLDRLAYCSATPFKEVALNIAFRKLGFKSIETFPIQDA